MFKLLAILLLTISCTQPAVKYPVPVESLKSKVVLISVLCEDSTKNTAGSGTIFNNNQVLTAFHVTDTDCAIFVKRGKEKQYPATVIKGNKVTDLALLKVEHNYNTRTYLGNSRLGERLTNLSYPIQLAHKGGSYLSILYGNLSTKDIWTGTRFVDRVSVDIYFGSSGSCVFNDIGNCVGVVSSGHMTRAGYNYVVRAEDIKRFMGEM